MLGGTTDIAMTLHLKCGMGRRVKGKGKALNHQGQRKTSERPRDHGGFLERAATLGSATVTVRALFILAYL